MTYTLRLDMSGEVFMCDSQEEIKDILDDRPLYTLKGITIYDRDDSLESWLKEECFDFEIIYSPKELLKYDRLEYTKDMSLSVLRKGFWRGEYNRFSKDTLADKEFVREIVKHKRWDGSCKYFSSNLLNDKEFVREIINNPWWDGSCLYFSSDLLSDKNFITEIINNPRWNGCRKSFKLRHILK